MKDYKRYKFCYVIFRSDELYISYLKKKYKEVTLIPFFKIGYRFNCDRIIDVSIKYEDIKNYGFKKDLDEYKSNLGDIGIITKTNKKYVIKENDYTKKQLKKILNILDYKVGKVNNKK